MTPQEIQKLNSLYALWKRNALPKYSQREYNKLWEKYNTYLENKPKREQRTPKELLHFIETFKRIDIEDIPELARILREHIKFEEWKVQQELNVIKRSRRGHETSPQND